MVLDRRRLLHSGAAALGAVALSGAVPPGTAARVGAPGGPPGGAPAAGERPTASSPYPAVGPGTAFLDHRSLLGDLPEPEWYEANIPFVDLPDAAVRDTYYYRWRVIKHALKYTGPQEGWILSEFLGPVGYSAPHGGINAAAAHHIREARWLRDHRYLDDYIDYWLRGSGSGPKPATDFLNENTTDWAHQYSFWIADAVVARASTDGRWEHALGLLDALERQWGRWAPQFDDEVGLYWQTPVWDAMEYTASSYRSDDPYHGGEGFRPTLNAYQYGDAKAIAALLRRRGHRGDEAKADRYDERARALQRQQERWLWDEEDQFYKHVMRDGNPERRRIADREQIGFLPWYFHMAPAGNAAAWAQLRDPEGFSAPFGPTTVERRSPWFMYQALEGCCRWNGPSWPFATSQTLTALANLLIDYPAQSHVDRTDYYAVLRAYALTHRKDGKPYVAEAHHPDEDRWIYDGRGHSEDYNHSTFNDLVLSGLLGIRCRPDATVALAPLVPRAWDHFAVENLPYHGHNLSVLFDRGGEHYGHGAGLNVWLNGRHVHRQAGLEPVTLTLGGAGRRTLPREVDDLANVAQQGHPLARASYTFPLDSPAGAIDGQDLHLDTPSSRWTNYGSPHADDWLVVDFGVPTPVSDLRISFYDDGGGVRTPDSYELHHLGRDGRWHPLPGQHRTPRTPRPGTLNRILLEKAVTTASLRLTALRASGGAVGVTAWQSWRTEDPRLTLTVETPPDGLVPVEPGGTARVTTTVTATATAVVSPHLLVPDGWKALPRPAVHPTTLRAGKTLRAHWLVTAPADLPRQRPYPLRLLVRSRGAGAERLVTSVVARAQAG
ncbi:MGH1-like glycoside hydrolase domain-containing protein [Streptomyces prasinopilosus]|uniref:NPCBM-associated, NEW3 domain of alpha-galactosidase n=2 Tax=Streptomyces prasinopilosus TaxID=67344 RepID=A0A1G6T6J3_9ACTN|nr:discoidin domain-containing protein [Streptomyces prasinopilosus]SDD24678.1 NPCBM-associated, NEW3 domain of alpha-galactosidase [Streptomyces prasinopilosus]